MDKKTLKDIAERKRQFAKLLLKHPHKASEHAYKVFPEHDRSHEAYEASEAWVNDREVIKLMAEIVEAEGSAAYLLSGDEAAREVLTIAQDGSKPLKERVVAYRLFSEMIGVIGKQAVNANVDISGNVAQLFETIGKQGRPKPAGAPGSAS